MKEYQYVYEADDLAAKCQSVPFLGSFSGDHLRRLLDSSKVREYEPDEVIIPEGQADRWLYVLMIGRVRILKDDEEIASSDQAGDVFGELAVIGDGVRSATVISAGRTYCLAIDGDFMKGLPADEQKTCHAILYRLFAKIIAERLRLTSEELAHAKQEIDRLKDQLKQARADG